jgi:hypothetical protein
MAVTLACYTEWRLALTWWAVQLLGWLLVGAAFAAAQLVSGNHSGLRGWWRWQQNPPFVPQTEVERVKILILQRARVQVGRLRVPQLREVLIDDLV